MAASNSRRLDVRGSSDGDMADADNKKVALERAHSARQFLIEHGIASDKIRLSATDPGDFNAVSGDELRRARNRRVEIEATDIDTSPYHAHETKTNGGSK